jgi:hypothetical protein
LVSVSVWASALTNRNFGTFGFGLNLSFGQSLITTNNSCDQYFNKISPVFVCSSASLHFVCPFICLFIFFSVCLLTCLSGVHLSIYPVIRQSTSTFCPSVHLSINYFVLLFTCLSVCLLFCLSIFPSFHLPCLRIWVYIWSRQYRLPPCNHNIILCYSLVLPLISLVRLISHTNLYTMNIWCKM